MILLQDQCKFLFTGVEMARFLSVGQLFKSVGRTLDRFGISLQGEAAPVYQR